MKFRTTCPHCASIFLLTSEQLSAAKGWVQCGVCAAAFNARPGLTRENGEPLDAPRPAEITAETPSDAAGSKSGPDLRDAVAATDISPKEDAPAKSAAVQGIGNRQEDTDLASIVLFDPDPPASEDYGALPDFVETRAAPSADARPRNAHESDAPLPDTTLPAEVPADAARSARRDAHVAEPAAAVRKVELHQARRDKAARWALAVALLTLGLLAQLGYFMRDTLASEIPALRPWLASACAALGCELRLPRDARLIQILGSDLQAEPAGPNHLRLKLTLANRAPYAQAWPVLVLTLTDRKDQPQARRSFAAGEYLADAALLETGIPAQSEYPLSLPLEVRQLTLAGYRVEIAY